MTENGRCGWRLDCGKYSLSKHPPLRCERPIGHANQHYASHEELTEFAYGKTKTWWNSHPLAIAPSPFSGIEFDEDE